MQDSHFTLSIAPDEKISPEAYGYWSVRWAADTARKYQESETSDYWQTYHMYLHLLSLFTASYWVYAIKVSNAPETIVEKLEIGFNDCLSDLLEPDGSPLSEQSKKLLYAYYRRYFVTLSDELDGPENHSKAPFSDLSEKFIEFVDYYFFKEKNMDLMERTLLFNQAADMPLIIFNLLKEQQLEYHA